MSWGSDRLEVTEETFSMIKAATSGIGATTGIAGLTMGELTSLVPCDVPFFTSTARVPAKQGAQFAMWQVLLNVNNQQPNPGIPVDQAGPLALISDQYMYSPYATLSSGGTVSLDAIAQGQNYADVLAVDTVETQKQLMIGSDIHQLVAQSFALPAAPTPTVTSATTGGSISTGTSVNVKVAARSGTNYYYGGSQAAGSNGAVTVGTTTSTNSATASCTAVKTACAYDWYVGSSSSNHVYYTTTTVNTVTITSIPTVAQTIPSLAGIANAGGAGPAAVPTADTSFDTSYQNGLLGSILGDYSVALDQIGTSGAVANLATPGAGTTQGAYYKSLDGAQLTVKGAALQQIDDMNRHIYDTYRVSTTRMLMGSGVITDIANAVLDNPQAITWLSPVDSSGRPNLVLGGAVAIYLNKTVNGKPIVLELMPNLPPSKIIAVIDSVPFMGSNVSRSLEVETLYDMFRYDYGANRTVGVTGGGPRYDFDVRSRQAFLNRAAPLMGIIDNIGDGVS